MSGPTILPDGTVSYPRRVFRTTGNRKIGPGTAGTAADRSTCPLDCDLWSECWAGNPTQTGGNMFDNVTRAPASLPTPDEEAARGTVRRGRVAFRASIVGDCLTPGPGGRRIVDRAYVAAANAIGAVYRAAGFPAWGYTHAATPHPDREHVTPGDFPGLTMRASTADPAAVPELHAAGWTVALAVDGPEHPMVGAVVPGPDGAPVRMTWCPAQRHHGRPNAPTCDRCGLCANRRVGIVFTRHGIASDKARGGAA